MSKIKVKLKFTEMQVMGYLLTQKSYEIHQGNYANKAVIALLVDYGLKSIMPHTYMSYAKAKALSMPIPVACAIIHFFQSIDIDDPYQLNVLRTVVMTIEPKLLKP
jgi:hypothetical protein